MNDTLMIDQIILEKIEEIQSCYFVQNINDQQRFISFGRNLEDENEDILYVTLEDQRGSGENVIKNCLINDNNIDISFNEDFSYKKDFGNRIKLVILDNAKIEINETCPDGIDKTRLTKNNVIGFFYKLIFK